MRVIKTYEGFTDWFRSDGDKKAIEILNRIIEIDSENVEIDSRFGDPRLEHGLLISSYVATINNKLPVCVLRATAVYNGGALKPLSKQSGNKTKKDGYVFAIKMDDNIIECSDKLKEDIFNTLKDLYNENILKNKIQNEGIVSWAKDIFKDSDEDIIGKRLLKKLEDVDPDNICTDPEDGSYIVSISKITTIKLKSEHRLYSTYLYTTHINDDEIRCSTKLLEKMYKTIDKIYRDEQYRLKLQRIDTSI